jgi:hypothetical protein
MIYHTPARGTRHIDLVQLTQPDVLLLEASLPAEPLAGQVFNFEQTISPVDNSRGRIPALTIYFRRLRSGRLWRAACN